MTELLGAGGRNEQASGSDIRVGTEDTAAVQAAQLRLSHVFLTCSRTSAFFLIWADVSVSHVVDVYHSLEVTQPDRVVVR